MITYINTVIPFFKRKLVVQKDGLGNWGCALLKKNPVGKVALESLKQYDHALKPNGYASESVRVVRNTTVSTNYTQAVDEIKKIVKTAQFKNITT
jgi:hypothetical protein